MVWLVMLVGIGAAYGMGVADGRKRAEGAAASREQDYQFRLEELARMLTQRTADAEARDGVTPDSTAATSQGREPLARARLRPMPAPADAAPVQSALAAEGP